MYNNGNVSMEPVTPEELRQRLRQGKTGFAFKKVNGQLRMAVGTLNMGLIPSQSQPTGGSKVRINHDQVRFWDLIAEDWRSIGAGQEIFINQ